MSVPIISSHPLAETEYPAGMGQVVVALHSNVQKLFLPEFESPDNWKMLSLDDLPTQQWEAMILRACPEVLLTGWNSFPLPRALLELDPLPLRYVCHMAGSVRSLIPREFLERGLAVSNWSSTVNHTVAEHAILLILAALRSLPAWKGYIRNPAERNLGHGSELRTLSLKGRRVGLHGFGGIAREIASRLRAFEVELCVWSDGVPDRVFEEFEVEKASSLENLFSSSEVLVECEALTPATRGSVTGTVLEMLPENAVFVNVGRGAVVDEAALFQLAAAGRLRVAVDVLQREPIAADSPLLDMPNVLISPHIAGPTSDTYRLCAEFALRNIGRYLRKEPLEGLVSLEMYDRST